MHYPRGMEKGWTGRSGDAKLPSDPLRLQKFAQKMTSNIYFENVILGFDSILIICSHTQQGGGGHRVHTSKL